MVTKQIAIRNILFLNSQIAKKLVDKKKIKKICDHFRKSLTLTVVSVSERANDVCERSLILYIYESLFAGNTALCRDQIRIPSPAPSAKPVPTPSKKKDTAKLIRIIAGSAAGGVLIFIFLLTVLIFYCRRKR